MRHVSLFTGIGGFELAAQRVWGDEYEPVMFCEMDEYAQRVLKKHWPDVPIIGDVRDVRLTTNTNKWESRSRTKPKPIQAEQLQSGANSRSSQQRLADREIDILTGGFPCQPFSAAGKRDGRSDNRHLWPEMHRVIQELQPAWVVAENVRGILSIEDGLVFEQVCLDLENAGYEVQPFVIPAVACDAHHRRDRVWFVAHQPGTRLEGRTRQGIQGRGTGLAGGCCDVSDTIGRGQSRQRKSVHAMHTAQSREGQTVEPINGSIKREWLSEPAVGRVVNGIPSRVDRLKCLGNAIVPQVAEQIFRAIKATEDNDG